MTGKVLYVGMGDSYIVVILFCINNFFSTKSLLNYICSIYSELPDIQAGLRKGRGTRDQIANIHWIIKKTREFQKNIYFCFIDYPRAFDCVDHNKLWKILQEMGIPAHLTCVLRNLYAGREATVRTRHGNPWLIHVNVWQKPLQYCKVISLQLIKKKINTDPYRKRHILHLQQEMTVLPSAGGRKIFFLPGNISTKERLSQLSQWKSTILQTLSFLYWTFITIF